MHLGHLYLITVPKYNIFANIKPICFASAGPIILALLDGKQSFYPPSCLKLEASKARCWL